MIAALIVLGLLVWCTRRPPLVLGTFNIQSFPHARTELEAVARALAELDADVVAVQEIGEQASFRRVLERASALTGRTYQATLVPSCRGRAAGRLQVGVVHDASRLQLVATRSLGTGETCPRGQPPGVIASLREGDGGAIAVASVHFAPGGHRFGERREQWMWLTTVLPRLSAELGAPIVIAGDVNSTGYLDRDSSERRFIDELVATRGLQLPTGALGCSMYWLTDGRYEPSLLDHVIVPRDMSLGASDALGMCAALACAPQDEVPPDFNRVSDHCPVRVELRR